jgi:hypothetical protein
MKHYFFFSLCVCGDSRSGESGPDLGRRNYKPDLSRREPRRSPHLQVAVFSLFLFHSSTSASRRNSARKIYIDPLEKSTLVVYVVILVPRLAKSDVLRDIFPFVGSVKPQLWAVPDDGNV